MYIILCCFSIEHIPAIIIYTTVKEYIPILFSKFIYKAGNALGKGLS